MWVCTKWTNLPTGSHPTSHLYQLNFKANNIDTLIIGGGNLFLVELKYSSLNRITGWREYCKNKLASLLARGNL